MKIIEAPVVPAQRHNLVGVVRVVNRWKYLVIGLTITAAIVSAVIAKLLPNEYRSTSVFYPSNLSTADPDRVVDGTPLEFYFKSEDIDRILTIGQSMPIAEYIIEKYDLYTHYGYDSSRSDLNKQMVLDDFVSNYSIEHTPQDAIEVSFTDKDKNFAALVANDITTKIDEMSRQLMYENRRNSLNLFKSRYEFMSKDYQALRDSLLIIRRKFGILDMGAESHHVSEYLSKQIVETESDLQAARAELAELQKHYGANNPKVVDLRAQIKGLESASAGLVNGNNSSLINFDKYLQGADKVSNMVAQLDEMHEPYIRAKVNYDNAKLALEQDMSTIYIVQKAIPAMKKSKPVRWIIVASTTFFTFFLSILVVSIIELYRKQFKTVSA